MKDNSDHDLTRHDRGHSHKVFGDPEMFARKFDAPERDVWQKPDEVIRSFNLPSDAVVLEIGSGTGYFTVRLSEYFKNGRVVALDESPEMVEYLKKRVDCLGIINVDTHISGKVDLIMCVDVYHHIKDRISYFSHLIPQLKPDGRLVIIDRAEDAPVGPSPAHRTPPELVKKELKEAGFELAQELDLLLPYQFYLIFKPVVFSDK